MAGISEDRGERDEVRQERRKWREGTPGQPPGPAVEAPNDKPDPSTIFVAGRIDVLIWTPEKRTWFNRMSEYATLLGFVPQEVDFQEPRARRTWSMKRTPLDVCLDVIRKVPGITFDDWAKECYPPLAEGGVGERAARKTAQVALSTLYRDGVVEKRYSATGNLHLFVVGENNDSELASTLTKERPRADYSPAAAQQLRADMRRLEPAPVFATNYESALRKIVTAPGILYDDWAREFHPVIGDDEVARRKARVSAEKSLAGMLKKRVIETRWDDRGRCYLFILGAVLPEREAYLRKTRPSEASIEAANRLSKKIATRLPEVDNPPTDEELFAAPAKPITKSLRDELEAFGADDSVDVPRREEPLEP